MLPERADVEASSDDFFQVIDLKNKSGLPCG